MSSFHTRLNATGLPIAQRLNGEQATYTPASGSARVITVVVTSRESREEEQRSQTVHRIILQTLTSKSAATGIPAAQHNDYLVIDDKRWRFERVVEEQSENVVIEWSATSNLRTRGT